MQMGANTDIAHQGKTLHVQTEDVSGETSPEIVTHLFLAGQIIVSQRTPYSTDDGSELVRERLRAQHQEMIRAVLSGQHDRALLLSRSRRVQSRDEMIPLARDKKRDVESER